jgi:dTDP-4-dehydrorhamnose 3,5-epimerase
MRFVPTSLPGLVEVELTPHRDARGFFARLYCPEEFAAAAVECQPVQMSLSRNGAAGTLRGMHWQAPPEAEAKVVRVVRGRIFDVAVDLRPESATCLRWHGCELSAEAGNALFIPAGFAHGFLTLVEDTDVLYQIDRLYRPGFARGMRFDDPKVGIAWPAVPRVISQADRDWPLL